MVDFNKKSLQEKYLESFHLLLCADDSRKTFWLFRTYYQLFTEPSL